MLYVAFIKNRPRWQLGHTDLQAKSRRWWNEGGRPAGIRTLGFYGTLGTEDAGRHHLRRVAADQSR